MTLVDGPNFTRLRGTWTGVVGSPYYSALGVDVDSDDVDPEVGLWSNMWEDIAGVIVNEAYFQSENIHPRIAIATGATVGVATSDEPGRPGEDTEEPLPWATQLYVALHTGEYVGGREIKGGFYVPALGQFVNNGGSPDGTAVVAVENALKSFFFDGAKLNGAGLVYSPTHAVAAYVSSVRVRRQFAVLRSRRD